MKLAVGAPPLTEWDDGETLPSAWPAVPPFFLTHCSFLI